MFDCADRSPHGKAAGADAPAASFLFVRHVLGAHTAHALPRGEPQRDIQIPDVVDGYPAGVAAQAAVEPVLLQAVLDHIPQGQGVRRGRVLVVLPRLLGDGDPAHPRGGEGIAVPVPGGFDLVQNPLVQAGGVVLLQGARVEQVEVILHRAGAVAPHQDDHDLLPAVPVQIDDGRLHVLGGLEVIVPAGPRRGY